MLLLAILLLLVNILSFSVVFVNIGETATGAASATATGTASLCVSKPPTITAIANQAGTVGTAFTLQVAATFYGANTSTSYFDNTSLFDINGSGYISFTPLTAAVGVHNILITAQDASTCNIAVNTTATFSLTIAAAAEGGGAPAGGGGGGGGGGAPAKKKINIEPSILPKEFDIGKTYDLTFLWAGVTHTISVSKIEGNSVTLLVKSTPTFITLDAGESEEVDLDDDKLKDISIMLLSVENDVAKLRIKIVREGILLSEDVLKVSIHQSQIFERKITVVHDWMENLEITLATSLENLLTIDPNLFLLPVKEKQPVLLTINPKRDAELGTYTGTVTVTAADASQKEEFIKTIVVVTEVESDSVLLDGSLDIREKTLQTGEELRVAVSVFNLLDVPVQDVTLLYEIFDQTNEVKYRQEEKISIEKQASFTKTIPVPRDLPAGQYVLSLKMIYADSFATATEIFTVEEKEGVFALAGLAAFAGGRTFLFAVPIMFVLIVGIVVALFLTQRKIRKVKTLKTPTVIKQRTIIKQKTIRRTIVKPKIIIKRDMSEYKRKLATLREGYKRGYIKEDTYRKLKAKLEEIIQKGS